MRGSGARRRAGALVAVAGVLATLLSGGASGAAAPSEVAASEVAASEVAAERPVARATPGRWRPEAGLTWQWQLKGRIDTSVPADVYDIDYRSPRSVVRELHAQGRKVVCYLSAGSWERYRADAKRFPRRLLGKRLDGWPDERWLDVRRRKALRPLMGHRLDQCARRGFDGVEPDNVDGYRNDTGFPLRAKHQRRYNRMIARMAHRRGLAVGLKNDLGQVRRLEPWFDFAVNEQCAQYDECGRLRPFLRAGKPVFHAEYRLRRGRFCERSRELGLSSIRKKRALGPWLRPC